MRDVRNEAGTKGAQRYAGAIAVPNAARHPALLALLIVLSCGRPSPALCAQTLPAIPVAGQQRANDESAADRAPAEKSLEERIAAARARIPEVKARRQVFDDPAYAPPAGITSRELENLRKYGDRLVMFSESALRSLQAQQQTVAGQRAFAAAAAAWQGFAERPPYSILMVDDLSDQLAVQREQLKSIRDRIATSERLIEDFRLVRAQADRDARRLAEESEAERKANQPAANWRWKAATLRLESVDAFIGWSLAELGRVKAERALIETRRGLLERQLAVAKSNAAFTKRDLAEAQSRLSQQISDVEARFAAVAAESKQLGEDLVSARQALEGARRTAADGGTDTAAALAAAEDRLRAINTEADSARTRGEILAVQLAALAEMKEAWADRYTLVNDGNPLQRGEAASRLRTKLERARALVANGNADAASFKSEEDVSAERLALLDPDSDAAAREREILGAIRDKLHVADLQRRAIERGLQAIARWLEEARVELHGELISERARYRGAEALLLLKRFWNLELFSIEDTMEIGGERVSVARPVTVRKIVTIALWIALGLWVSRFSTRYAHRRLIEHYQMGAAQAEVLRRWITALNVVILLLIGLYLVRIPLTAFAFLGGALAIGFGFGTQTLIKNLVSGVLMLLQRQIRAGDVVEIEGTVGTVVAVDVRSTRMRGFDGKETLIPNSMFLESKFTNWTLTTRQVRLSVEVGVAYRSPARTVARLLAECALQHGQVLKDPAPFVRFQAFGASSLDFALYFWVEIADQESGKSVASDLRFTIEQSFAEHGILIAWPTRDPYRDDTQPIRIEVVKSERTDSA